MLKLTRCCGSYGNINRELWARRSRTVIHRQGMQWLRYERLKKTARCKFLLSYERLIEWLDESGSAQDNYVGT
ncbi:hypothetical protein OKW11_000294 [Pseudomonas baetica]|nr:hypothetical protein [Pseudomonas baetica]